MSKPSKRPNNIICVCNEANDATCEKCGKFKRIKPGLTMNYPMWDRDLRSRSTENI